MAHGRIRGAWIGLGAVVLALAVLAGALVLAAAVALSQDEAGAARATPTEAPAQEEFADGPADEAAALAAFDEQQAYTELEARLIEVYERASAAVVNITTRSYVYYRFMGAVPSEGMGSGFVYDGEGHIVTAYHVIEGADELLVTLAGGEVFEAAVVGADPENDLAVIQIDAGTALPAAPALGDSDALRVGQVVVAIGNPYGLEQTMTSGVVSALGRVIEGAEDGSFIGEAIQTDAAINPGNSGGPLLNLQGEVVGVNSQIISASGASAGIGFAVSANTVQRIVPELIAKGYYAHPWLGLNTVTMTSSTARVLREAGVEVATDTGVLVVSVTAGSPADQAGLQGGQQWVRFGPYRIPIGGDIIIAADGQLIPDEEALTVYLEMHKVTGDVVELTVLRGAEELTIPVTVGAEPQ